MKTITLPLTDLPDWLLENYPNLIFHAGLAEFVAHIYEMKLHDYEINEDEWTITIEMIERSVPLKKQSSIMALSVLSKNKN